MNRSHATIKDVASHAGVSTATVSRVLNNDEAVSEQYRSAVHSAVHELGYKLNRVARSLKTNSTGTVGVLAPSLSGDFFMFIAESLDRELSAHGYTMVVASTRGSILEESRQALRLTERLVDGVVVIPASGCGSHFKILHDRNIPLVFLDRVVDDFTADSVLVDNEQAAYGLVKKLILDGHTRIGYIGGTAEISTSRERFAGYERALFEHNLPLENRYIKKGPPSLPFGYRAMEEIVKSGDPPHAMFVVNAFTHVGATNYLLTQGASRYVVFAAFDEMPYSPLLQYCKYSVQQPIAEMGRAAATLIIDRISGSARPAPHNICLKTRLITHER